MWQEYRRFFPKETKYTLGEKIDSLLVECLEATLTAIFLTQEQRRQFVHKAIVKIDTVNVLLRISWELKSLDTKKYTALSLPLTEAGRQLGGWHNKLLKENSANKKAAEK